jgi:hypothetical protein
VTRPGLAAAGYSGREAPEGGAPTPSGGAASPSADLLGAVPPGGPQRRQVRPSARPPTDPAGHSVENARGGPQVDFPGASRCPPRDGDQPSSRLGDGCPAALPPGALRPLARAIVAAAIELRADLRLLPDERQSPRTG